VNAKKPCDLATLNFICFPAGGQRSLRVSATCCRRIFAINKRFVIRINWLYLLRCWLRMFWVSLSDSATAALALYYPVLPCSLDPGQLVAASICRPNDNLLLLCGHLNKLQCGYCLSVGTSVCLSVVDSRPYSLSMTFKIIQG